MLERSRPEPRRARSTSCLNLPWRKDIKGPVTCRKTKRAEKIAGFDQGADFIIPREFNPQVVIEAKLTEDDGTARDKVTPVQHLAEFSAQPRLGAASSILFSASRRTLTPYCRGSMLRPNC